TLEDAITWAETPPINTHLIQFHGASTHLRNRLSRCCCGRPPSSWRSAPTKDDEMRGDAVAERWKVRGTCDVAAKVHVSGTAQHTGRVQASAKRKPTEAVFGWNDDNRQLRQHEAREQLGA